MKKKILVALCATVPAVILVTVLRRRRHYSS